MEAWLRFLNLPIGPRLANALLDRFGDPETVFAASPRALADVAGFAARHAPLLADPRHIPTESQRRYLEQNRVCIVPRSSDEYPRNLRDVTDAPVALFIRGKLDERDRFAVAIVGTRHPTPYGRSVTARLAADLAQAGLTIVSGGAAGIDAAAHRAVLEAGGRTLVVLGCGLDIPYPRENQQIFADIVERGQGAVVSEFPPGAPPDAWRFPLRNRVISGLANGVIVTEAGEQSGALITATNAGEQGREVMAVPGNVDRPQSRGTNGLIRDGAVLVETSRDVLAALNLLTLETPRADKPAALPPVAANLNAAQKRLIENLSLTPRHIDALAADARMSPVDVSVQMTMLELSGLVRRMPGNCYIRVL
jgi:DNA processing protein